MSIYKFFTHSSVVSLTTFLSFVTMTHNGLGYKKFRGLALNFASTHQTENLVGSSEVGENKQLLIAIVVHSFFIH